MAYEEQKIFSFLPVRGGSVGIPNKNRKSLAGKPLMAHSIQAAKDSQYLDRNITITEDKELANVANIFGSEVYERPGSMADSKAQIEPSYIRCVEQLAKEGEAPDICVLLHATCPLRNGKHIDEAIEVFIKEEADSLLSVYRPHAFYWEKDEKGEVKANYDTFNRPNRQQYQANLRETPAIYITKREQLLSGKNRLGGKVSFYEIDFFGAFDIDEPWDFEMAEILFKWQLKLNPKI